MPDIEDYVTDGQVDYDAYYSDVDAYFGRIVDRIALRSGLVVA